MQGLWVPNNEEAAYLRGLFEAHSTGGRMAGMDAVRFLSTSGLPKPLLREVGRGGGRNMDPFGC